MTSKKKRARWYGMELISFYISTKHYNAELIWAQLNYMSDYVGEFQLNI